MAKRLFIVGTSDTKRAELSYAKSIAESAGAKSVLVDVGTTASDPDADFPAAQVAGFHPDGRTAVLDLSDRGRAVSAMAIALTRFLLDRVDVGAVLGLGGSGNTAIVTEAMRALPIGLPKLMLSTVASGNTSAYVGPNDIAMMYSVADIAGLNAISRVVIGNAANAAAGMFLNSVAVSHHDKPAIGMTMFGVTTQVVTEVREQLEATNDVVVFHATGVGGQSMEKLTDSGFFKAIIDLTTTEVPDHLIGGVFACSPDRFGSIIRSKLPYIGSLGAVDMVNFGAEDTVPDQFRDRNLYVHNPQITLMRTTPEENEKIGRFIVQRLNQMEGPVRFLLPLAGVSALDAPGMPFHDVQTNAVLFETIRKGWKPAPNRELIELDANINDPAFTAAVIQNFNEIS